MCLFSASTTMLGILGAIASVVTPLGLGEKLATVGMKAVAFEYAQDTSSIAIGTSLRSNGSFHRICEDPRVYSLPCPCPYTGDTMETTHFKNGSVLREFPYGIHTEIPFVLREVFSSGTASQRTTISNSLDIEWRQLTMTAKDENFDNGTAYEQGMYRQLDSILLQDGYKVFEGLIIDNKMGGIGFRNHTIPTGLSYGATWKEDLLFVEPDVSCVNTNLSIDFEIATAKLDNEFRDVVLTDRGGFADLNMTHLPVHLPKSQINPDLQARAYDAAVLNNKYTMMIYNITDRSNNSLSGLRYPYIKSDHGDKFPLIDPSNNLRSLEVSTKFGSYFYNGGFNLTQYSNPYNVTGSDLDSINTMCTGADDTAGNSTKQATISNIYMQCGILRGAPVRINDGSPLLFEEGSKWSSKLYTCAATVRATIKTVSFSFNATDSSRALDGLRVTGIDSKEYINDTEVPLWGFEESGSTFDAIQPLWGLISSDYQSRQNLSSVRQPYFFIPGYRSLFGRFGPKPLPNLASSIFASRTMDQVFAFDDHGGFDLQGSSSTAILRRWQSLSQNATSAATIIKLTWTDLASSAVVGTKGVMGRLNKDKSDSFPHIQVSPIERTITYRFSYGIPAFVLLLSFILVGITSMISACLQNAGVARLRLRIHQTSVGRAYTTHLYPDDSSLTMSSREWRESNGYRPLKLTHICAGEELGQSERQHDVQSGKEPDQTVQRLIQSRQS
ncbi:hypothetical protein NLG97_g1406 [Lecanicillium saksenae]|uniref:Uncharacterized protein n=1 Tax=Lecanicillium saksenae TaxID=468837 RepID=A0ACC1R756_9HYPO|nr:hypothetical protein NLG97_g1406 [Lecanicillium saksenae]